MAKKRKKQSSTQFQSRGLLLPDDILLEIFQRLPVNSLLRFTTVSKSWSSSIKNPSFISSYHHRHHDDDESHSRSHLVFVLTPHPPHSPVQIFSLIPKTRIIPNYNPVLKFSDRATVVGFCEGLICFETTSGLYVWNPFIRKSLKKVLACEIPVNTARKGKLLSTVLGFGFAPKSRDHRVVKVLCTDNHLSEVEVEIYSLASDSWRRIKSTYADQNSKMVSFSTSHVYLDGSIYWLIPKYGTGLILRFDLEEEKFEEIALPFIYLDDTLVVIKGFLVIWRVRREFGGRRKNAINVEAYIIGKSDSGSSSFRIAKTVSISRPVSEISWHHTTMEGHIIVTVLQDGHQSVVVYDGCCDGKNLSFKRRNPGIIKKGSSYPCIVPIKKTLFLLDKK